MESRSLPDYLIIGHVSHDLTPEGFVTGGTVSYSGLTAQALGCKTCVVTSAGADFDPVVELPGLKVHVIPAADTTTFDNIYTAEGRQQYLHKRANRIEPGHIPPDWLQASIVHLAPVDMEFDPAMIQTFSNSKIGITPQGWLRSWDETGKIGYKSWQPDAAVLSKAAVLVISEEDIPPEESLCPYREHVPILVQTRGRQGCTVFQGEAQYDFPAPAVQEVNPTGAGDIFATAFMIRLHQTNSIPEAAVFANEIAALSVTGKTLLEKAAIIQERLQSNL
jgi:sugar/nucleoside kinase (ribokinase family)